MFKALSLLVRRWPSAPLRRRGSTRSRSRGTAVKGDAWRAIVAVSPPARAHAPGHRPGHAQRRGCGRRSARPLPGDAPVPLRRELADLRSPPGSGRPPGSARSRSTSRATPSSRTRSRSRRSRTGRWSSASCEPGRRSCASRTRGRAKVADGPGVFHVYVAGGTVYAAGRRRRRIPARRRVAHAADPADGRERGRRRRRREPVRHGLRRAGSRRSRPTGRVTTVAGNGTEGYSGDGGPADRRADLPPALA